MTKHLILSQYPITDNTRDHLREKLGGEIRFLVITHFAHSGYLNLIKQLRSLECEKLYIYTALTENNISLPVLRCMACLINSKKKYIINDQATAKEWGRFSVLKDFFRMVWSFCSGVFALLISVVYLKTIHHKARVPVSIARALASKRVLYIRPALWQGLKAGGAISHSRGVISGLLKMGFYVECLADSDFVNLPESSGKLTVLQPRNAYILPRELNYFNFQKLFIKRTLEVIGRNYDGLIYQRLSVGSLAGVVLSRFWRIPLIIEYNGNEVWLARNWGSSFFFEKAVDFVERVILDQAHLIVTVSHPLKTELIGRGVDADRIIVNPNGVDLDQYNPGTHEIESLTELRKSLGFNNTDIIFTFVGTFGAWHGAVLLADAILSILQSDEADPHGEVGKICFLLVGNGVEFSEVQKKLSAEIQNGRVVMTGLVDPEEVPSLLAMSDVCLSPTLGNLDGSEFFGSPTKLFEYMAAGKPVIASAVGQLREVLSGSPEFSKTNNQHEISISKVKKTLAAGILVPAGNMELLQTAILQLAYDKNLRNILSLNARTRAEQSHSWLKHVENIINTLQKQPVHESSRVRVLINALHSKSGGGVTYIRNMVPYLIQNNDLDVHIVLQQKQVSLFEDCLKNANTHIISNQNNFREMFLTEQFLLPKLAKKIQANVIFSAANYGPLWPSDTVILLRNSLEVASVERRLRKMGYWFALTAATLISIIRAREAIAVSNYAKNASIGAPFKGLREGISIIPHGISDVFRTVNCEGSTAPFILTVSDIYVQKNIEILIRGFADILKTWPDLKLKIAGRPVDQDYYNHINILAHDLGVEGSIQFLGHVEQSQLLDLYRSCSVFVFPSTVETFGNPLVEAMACGCPIVSSNAAAMPEVAGDAVVYINPNSPTEISDAIRQFLEDEGLRTEYGAKAKERAAKYSWAETARKTTEVIIRAANTKPCQD